MVPKRTDTWYVSYALIAVNVVVFIVGVAMGDSLDGGGNEVGLVHRAATLGGNIEYLNEWWRVFTGGFLHHGVFHLGVNMFSLYILGLALERSLGKVSFTAVYLSSLVSGSFGALIEAPNSLVAGASGAIFGLMGAYVALSLAQGVGLFQTPIGPILAINLVISFTVRSVSLGGHIGGLIGGFLVGAAAAQAIRRQQHTTVIPVLAAAVVAGASFVGALWAASRSNVVLLLS
ncbi:MAG: rhomboid family intramembrane serine protease [Acidimicrobiia bacterium]|nr:rhomboid family intramembrane serine protease [Acidimicrobiia bacterium]MYE73560.1 rhomboid family intramembrane serine protease [Acidimicrobiia bacterium]MYJ62307.1 rhomboid family intramembrane serine protease [Acidimicrobiia bacterium]